MKKLRIKRGALLAFAIVLASISFSAARADIEPPAMTDGWSLVSAPCDVSVAEILDKTGFNQLNVFEWNGSAYSAVDTIKRGRGYAADSNRAIGAAGLCANSNDDDPLVIRLPEGWNLIGNPYKRATRVHYILGGLVSNFDDQVFRLRGNAYETISMMDVLQPWDAVWVYAYAPVVIPHNVDCETTDFCDIPDDPPALVSLVLSSDKSQLFLGESASLTAMGGYSKNIQADITTEASFELSDAAIGSIEAGIFSAASEGKVTIAASVGDVVSNSINITVIDPARPVELTVTLKPAMIQIHQTATLTASARLAGGGVADVTALAEWNFSSDAGRLESSGKFFPAKTGDTIFSASYAGLVGNAVTLSVIEKQLIWLGLYPARNSNLKPLPCPSSYDYMYCYSNNYIEIDKTGAFTLIAEYNDNTARYDTVNFVEKWDIEDKSVLSIGERGAVTPLKTGRSGVRAYYDGVWSEWAQVQVVDGSTEDFLILEYSNSPTIARLGEEIVMNATYYTRVPGQGVMPPYYVYMNYVTDGVFEARKVTSSANWTLTNKSVGSFNRDAATFIGSSIGATSIFATYNDRVSNFARLEIWDSTPLNHCSPDSPNAATWTDNITIARLASDCDNYSTSDTINVNFAALLRDGQYRGTLDVCADMFIYNSEQELVKTFRNTDCTPASLFGVGSPTYKTVYEYNAAWDQTDESGAPVPPGNYTAIARFYILYCPVIKVEFTISED